MSTTLSKSPEQTKQTVLNQVSESESKTNQERNTKKSKLEHTVMTEFEPEMDQLLSVDGTYYNYNLMVTVIVIMHKNNKHFKILN